MTSSEIEIKVRYVECDPLGIVHHSNYFVYFEMARVEQLRIAGINYTDLNKNGIFVVLSEVGAKFRAPARFDDTIIIRCTIERITSMRIRHRYDVIKQLPSNIREHIGEGWSTLACVNLEGELVAVPDFLKPIPPKAELTSGSVNST